MGTLNLKIFFDESGKKSNGPLLMGALSIPQDIYNLENVQNINNKLKNKEINFHFTKYNGHISTKNNIVDLITTMTSYLKTIRFNVIKYKVVPNYELANNFDTMVYSKFPERLFYGLLRCKGSFTNISGDIFIEDATEYHNFPDKFKEQLNNQATYRGENFSIENCVLLAKNSEIGIELTDLLLGVIKTILQNQILEDSTSAQKAKILLVCNLLSLNDFYNFLCNIKYFEWDYTCSLREINFKEYLDYFVARNFTYINI